MTKPLRILGIAGGLRRDFHSRMILRVAGGLMPQGASLATFEIGEAAVHGHTSTPTAIHEAQALRRSARAADGILFITPDYDCAMPSAVKDAIDWASRPNGNGAWNAKPTLILGLSLLSSGATRDPYGLWQPTLRLRLFPLSQPELPIANAIAHFDNQGNLGDGATMAAVRHLLQELKEWVGRTPPPYVVAWSPRPNAVLHP